MLKQNIYLLYPPGYSGTYVNWAISKSETGMATTTVNDPITTNPGLQFGGPGTAHTHRKNPTHLGAPNMLTWIINNRPADKRIYPINNFTTGATDVTWSTEFVINYFARFDPDAVFINIHDDNDEMFRKIANINAVTKWPVMFLIQHLTYMPMPFDVTAPNSIESRNGFVKTLNHYLPFNPPINREFLGRIFKDYETTILKRKEFNPHELDMDEYPIPKLETTKVRELALSDLFSNRFPTVLESLLEGTDAGTFDFEYLTAYHNNYIKSQPHLRLKYELTQFAQTHQLTEYLTSHSLLEAYVLQILGTLPTGWEEMSTGDIVKKISSEELIL